MPFNEDTTNTTTNNANANPTNGSPPPPRTNNSGYRRNSLDSLGGGWFGYDGFQGWGGNYDDGTTHYNNNHFNYGSNYNNNSNYGNYYPNPNSNDNNNFNSYRRNSLLGGGMMPRGSMGFGYNGGNSGGGGYNNPYYGNAMGGYNSNYYGNLPQQGMGNGTVNNDATTNAMGGDGSHSNTRDSQLPDTDDIDLDEDDPEQTIDYLAARAHAAQILAQEEAKRLEDNLKRLEAKRQMNLRKNSKSGSNTRGDAMDMSNNKDGLSNNVQGGKSQQPNDQVNQGMNPMNSNMQQQHHPHFQDFYNNNFFNPGNNMTMQNVHDNAMNMPNFNNGNSNNSNTANDNSNNNMNITGKSNNKSNTAQSKDEQLFERSRLNNYQMNMRNATNHMMDNNNNFHPGGGTMNHAMNYNYPGYAMMPHMMMDYSHGMNSMQAMSNNVLRNPYTNVNNANSTNNNNNGINNDDAPQSQQDKKRKRTSESSDIPPSPKKKDAKAIRRPLSAYNIFFSEMRETILREEEEKAKDETAGDGDEGETTVDEAEGIKEEKGETSVDDETDNIQAKDDDKPQDAQSKDDSTNTNKDDHTNNDKTPTSPTKDLQTFTQSLMKKRLQTDPTRRIHRKTHGKVSFTTLVRLVGRRWKELPEESKARYKELAELDQKRYKKEKMEAQKTKREEARRVRKMLKQVHRGSYRGGDGGEELGSDL